MRLTYAERIIIDQLHFDITNNYVQKFLIEGLCLKHAISETKLTKGFKQVFGVTIYRYRLEKCMEHARDAFKQGASVKDIAVTFEYSSIGSFSRAFRKVYPRPPSHYRYVR